MTSERSAPRCRVPWFAPSQYAGRAAPHPDRAQPLAESAGGEVEVVALKSQAPKRCVACPSTPSTPTSSRMTSPSQKKSRRRSRRPSRSGGCVSSLKSGVDQGVGGAVDRWRHGDQVIEAGDPVVVLGRRGDRRADEADGQAVDSVDQAIDADGGDSLPDARSHTIVVEPIRTQSSCTVKPAVAHPSGLSPTTTVVNWCRSRSMAGVSHADRWWSEPACWLGSAAMAAPVTFDELFSLEPAGDDTFRAISAEYPWGQVYGGQARPRDCSPPGSRPSSFTSRTPCTRISCVSGTMASRSSSRSTVSVMGRRSSPGAPSPDSPTALT